MSDLESFRRAFDPGAGSCRGQCICGETFYSPDAGFDLEESEIKELEDNPHATPLPHSVGFVEIHGATYISDCKCWHKKAEGVMDFIDGNMTAIAKYLKLEKERIAEQANDIPDIEED